MTITKPRRRELLDEAFECMLQLSTVKDERSQLPPGKGAEYSGVIDELGGRLHALTNTYIEQLAIIQMSSCPFTGKPFHHSWDEFGLDGLWWNYHKSARPLVEKWGGAFHALSGAVQVNVDYVEYAPFLTEPGPDVPFLLPRLMDFESIVAVVSQLKVGEHTAYPIVYFSETKLPWKRRANDWGRNHFCYKDDRGAIRVGEHFDAEDEHVYDLNDAIESNRLRWIAPDDKDMRVQNGLVNCPFVNLPGARSVARTRAGELWRPED